MCIPASFVVTKERVFWSKNTDSHEEIICEFRLKEMDVRGTPTLVRIEITPPMADLGKPLTDWVYHLDRQDIRPSWYDAADVERRARSVLPQWRDAKVVGPGEVREKHTEGQIYVYGGTVQKVYNGGTVQKACGGTVQEVYGGGTVQEVYGGTVQKVYNGGTVQKVYGGSVQKVCDGTVQTYVPLAEIELIGTSVLIERVNGRVSVRTGDGRSLREK